MDNISEQVREMIMGSATDKERSEAPAPVTGSFNVVGNNNTVVFPGGNQDWDEKRAFILRALPQLSERELEEIQALVQRRCESADKA